MAITKDALFYFYLFNLFYEELMNVYKKKEYKHILIYIFLSIIYFTAAQSWYGGTMYIAPILIYIYLSFLFSYRVTF